MEALSDNPSSNFVNGVRKEIWDEYFDDEVLKMLCKISSTEDEIPSSFNKLIFDYCVDDWINELKVYWVALRFYWGGTQSAIEDYKKNCNIDGQSGFDYNRQLNELKHFIDNVTFDKIRYAEIATPNLAVKINNQDLLELIYSLLYDTLKKIVNGVVPKFVFYHDFKDIRSYGKNYVIGYLYPLITFLRNELHWNKSKSLKFIVEFVQTFGLNWDLIITSTSDPAKYLRNTFDKFSRSSE